MRLEGLLDQLLLRVARSSVLGLLRLQLFHHVLELNLHLVLLQVLLFKQFLKLVNLLLACEKARWVCICRLGLRLAHIMRLV